MCVEREREREREGEGDGGREGRGREREGERGREELQTDSANLLLIHNPKGLKYSIYIYGYK